MVGLGVVLFGDKKLKQSLNMQTHTLYYAGVCMCVGREGEEVQCYPSSIKLKANSFNWCEEFITLFAGVPSPSKVADNFRLCEVAVEILIGKK